MADIAALDIRVKSTGINKATKDLGSLEKGSRKVETATQRMERSFLSLKNVAITAFAGWGFERIVSNSLSAFSAFDKGLIGIQKTTNMTDKQMLAMGESIRKMAGEIPVATTGLLEIAEAAGQLGVTGVKNVTLFTETLAKMQIASDVVGAEGAKALARLLNTAGEATEGVKVLGSVIVSLGNQMAASEAEIVHMASEIGRGTAAFNVSSAASVAYGAALKAMGARAELSGSAITRSMIEIEKAIISGGEKFLYLQKVTGMTGETIERVFKEDSSIIFNAFIKGAHGMTEEGISAISILEKFGLKGTEVIKGLTPLIKNVEQLEKAFAIANKEVKNATALDIEAMRASSSFSAQMRMTKNVVDEIASGIGKGLAPKIVEVTQNFRDWVEQNEKFISQDMPEKIGAIATKVKTLIDTFNKVPKEIVGIGGAGLIGALFFGGKAGLVIAGIASAIILADKLSDKIAEAIIPAKDLADAWAEIHTAQGILLIRKDDIDAYFLSLNEGSETVKGLGDNANKAFTKMQQDADKANKELEKFYKLMEKSKVAMDQVTLAAFPEFERGIESIHRKYDKWNLAIEENAEKAGKSAEEIALLYANLGLRMDEEIDDYVKSYEKGTDEIYDLWQHTYEKMTDTLADFFETGKFNLSDFVDFFKRQMAQMAAAWVMGDQAKSGFSFSNMFGGMGQGGTTGSIAGDIGQSIVSNQAGGWAWDNVKGAWSWISGGSGVGAAGGMTYTAAGMESPWAVGASGYSQEAIWSGQAGGTGAGASTTGWSAAGTYVSYAGLGYLIGNVVSSVSGDETHPEYSGYGGAAGGVGGGFVAGAAFGAKSGSWGGYIGAAVGAIIGAIGGALFGGGREHRPRGGIGVSGSEWDPLSMSFQYPDEQTYPSKVDMYSEARLGWARRQSGEPPEGLAQVFEEGLLNVTATWDTIFTSLADLMGNKGEEWLRSLDIAFDFTWVETRVKESSDIEDFMSDLQNDFYQGSFDALREGMNIIWSTSKETFQNTWDILDERLKGSIENTLGALPDLDRAGDWEEELAKIDEWIADVATVREFFEQVTAITTQIAEVISLHDYSDSVKSAVGELKSINVEFEALGTTLMSLGIDLEKYTDLQKAYNMAIQDWIQKAFVGAINYASTSQGWQAMAPQSTSLVDQYVGQYQHIDDLYMAYDGTTASAIELSDALGILSSLSYDLASEIQGAINSIHESYTSALESMYLETLSGQGKYDYYRAKVDELYAELPNLTSAAAIQQYMDDILQYSTAAFGMMDEAQKKQHYPDYEAFLTGVETEGTAKLEEIGNAMNNANDALIEKVTPLIVNMVTDIQAAAQLQIGAANTQMAAANGQLDAAGIPIRIELDTGSGEVGD